MQFTNILIAKLRPSTAHSVNSTNRSIRHFFFFPKQHRRRRFVRFQTNISSLPRRNSFLQAVHLLHRQQQRLRAHLLVSLRLHRDVQLVGERESRQAQIHPLGFVQSDSHVLNEVLHEEAGIEVALDHARAQIAYIPRASGAGAHGSDNFVEIQSRLVAVQKALANANLDVAQRGKRYHVRGDEDLVAHLGVLAAARFSHVSDVRSHALHVIKKKGRANVPGREA